ncbi:MAG: hypothetical protein WDN28_00880 [Chthoniobacter sp.]
METASGTSGTVLNNAIALTGDVSLATNVDAANPGSQNFSLNGSIDLNNDTRTITGTTAGGAIHLGGVISNGGVTFGASAGVTRRRQHSLCRVLL